MNSPCSMAGIEEKGKERKGKESEMKVKERRREGGGSEVRVNPTVVFIYLLYLHPLLLLPYCEHVSVWLPPTPNQDSTRCEHCTF